MRKTRRPVVILEALERKRKKMNERIREYILS